MKPVRVADKQARNALTGFKNKQKIFVHCGTFHLNFDLHPPTNCVLIAATRPSQESLEACQLFLHLLPDPTLAELRQLIDFLHCVVTSDDVVVVPGVSNDAVVALNSHGSEQLCRWRKCFEVHSHVAFFKERAIRLPRSIMKSQSSGLSACECLTETTQPMRLKRRTKVLFVTGKFIFTPIRTHAPVLVVSVDIGSCSAEHQSQHRHNEQWIEATVTFITSMLVLSHSSPHEAMSRLGQVLIKYWLWTLHRNVFTSNDNVSLNWVSIRNGMKI